MARCRARSRRLRLPLRRHGPRRRSRARRRAASRHARRGGRDRPTRCSARRGRLRPLRGRRVVLRGGRSLPRTAASSTLAPPYEPRAIFGAARAGDPLARSVVHEVARRIALHIVPIAAVADVGLVVLGGGIGANGDLLLDPDPRAALQAGSRTRRRRRGLEPRRGCRAVRGARGRPAHSARQRVRQPREGGRVTGWRRCAIPEWGSHIARRSLKGLALPCCADARSPSGDPASREIPEGARPRALLGGPDGEQLTRVGRRSIPGVAGRRGGRQRRARPTRLRARLGATPPRRERR